MDVRTWTPPAYGGNPPAALDGAKFTNPTYRVTLEGPDGRAPSVNAAGYLFEVAYRCRNLETSPPRNSTGTEALPRMIRLAMSDDLLLVLHGYGQDQSDRGLVTASFDTLRRTRYEPPRRPRPRRPER